MKIALTGYTGFVGSFLLDKLSHFDMIVIGRKRPASENVTFFESADDFNVPVECLSDVDVFIHCAAKTHSGGLKTKEAVESFRNINVLAVINLATKAAKAGVKRFIFISSIKVNGEATKQGHSFRNSDLRAPEDAYGRSKSEAEVALETIGKNTGMDIVIIRPPLVYGPGVTGNFAHLISAVKNKYPLPFGLVKNRRSMVSIFNLVDFISVCIEHPRASNQIFLVSDGEDVSTPSLLKYIADALDVNVLLVPVYLPAIRFIFTALGLSNLYNRVYGDLQVNIAATTDILGWIPPLSVKQSIDLSFGKHKE